MKTKIWLFGSLFAVMSAPNYNDVQLVVEDWVDDGTPIPILAQTDMTNGDEIMANISDAVDRVEYPVGLRKIVTYCIRAANRQYLNCLCDSNFMVGGGWLPGNELVVNCYVGSIPNVQRYVIYGRFEC